MSALTFLSYEVEDTGIAMKFLDPVPTENKASHYVIRLSFAELDAISTQLQLRNAVIARLQRKVQAVGYASKLDVFIGQSVTI